jgi:ABC-type Fe3+-hydroxamate transport system substrate-binding protein
VSRRAPALLGLLALLALLAAACDGSAAQGARAAAPPRRICSVNLGTDELLYFLAGPERVIAVSVYADDPGLSNVVGLYPDPVARVRANLEQILALRPDLVCASPYNSADFLEILAGSGLATFRHDEVTTFEGIRRGIRSLGDRVGAPERAAALVSRRSRPRSRARAPAPASSTGPRAGRQERGPRSAR